MERMISCGILAALKIKGIKKKISDKHSLHLQPNKALAERTQAQRDAAGCRTCM